MELRDGDIELRPWTLDDVPAIVAACNDAEIQHWIPVIPRPYTEADARAFVRRDVAGIGTFQFAVTAGGREGVLRSHLAHPDGRRCDSVMFSLLPGELV